VTTEIQSSTDQAEGQTNHDNNADPTYAAVDLGTNNCRLLIAKPANAGFRVIDSFSRIVRLGEGVAASGKLSEGAITRTIEALKICAGKMVRRDVTRMRGVATAACRSAQNHEEFIERVRTETGMRLDVIGPDEEARLAVSGCVSLFDDAEYAFVFDIGGGSTELIWVNIEDANRPRIDAWTSLPVGVVSLAEKYGGEHVTPDSYEAMVQHVMTALKPFEETHRLKDLIGSGAKVHMIGTSGTVTTVAGIHLGLRRYDRRRVDGLWISQEDVEAVSRRLAEMSYEERLAEPCVGRERADLVVAGCAIYEAISRTWPSERLRVADRGLREGVLLDLMRELDSHAQRVSVSHS
jgi:exopolyphosphatase/guanosine-5'-triphosphate,3'-diphosphate pyrophosphatase